MRDANARRCGGCEGLGLRDANARLCGGCSVTICADRSEQKERDEEEKEEEEEEDSPPQCEPTSACRLSPAPHRLLPAVEQDC